MWLQRVELLQGFERDQEWGVGRRCWGSLSPARLRSCEQAGLEKGGGGVREGGVTEDTLFGRRGPGKPGGLWSAPSTPLQIVLCCSGADGPSPARR